MINYILQVILFQVLFLAIYDFFLSKETFFTKNRWYLLSTPLLSFVIPLIKIPTFQKAVPKEFMMYLPEIVLSPEKVITKTVLYQSINYVDIVFWIGVSIFSILFLIKLGTIINFIRKHKAIKKKDFTLIYIPNKTNAFSFFNYVFLGNEIPETQQAKILEHELVHSKQKHSLDLLFFEFLKIVMWFNPMIYIYQKRITLLHEYISDAIIAKSETKETYINNLLSSFFQVENISFINQFYKQTFIKKRIMMMTKKQSKKMNQLKYLVLIPVLTTMLFYTSCNGNYSVEVVANKEIQTIYSKNKAGELDKKSGKKTTYLDSYFGLDAPKLKEISYVKLTSNEQLEYNNHIENMKEKAGDIFKFLDFKIYKGDNGRSIIGNIINISKMKNFEEQKIKDKNGEITEIEEVSFMKIEKAPTFPGCETGDKACFSKSIQKHFIKNFNADLPKTLGLKAGRKRIFIGFTIDKEGTIVDVKARAPHEKIEQEVLRVMNSLPKMIPGEQAGKPIGVKYSIPFTIVVE